ncbi:MAG TPA: TadE/TadG family type IV pilus assembly protein [Rhodoblastus sp.]|nr:TadE/TadG family type IV pilus assembly protein [Rhodoblastus sp.]
MSGLSRTLFARATTAFARLRAESRRFGSRKAGIAAVEFALLLPLMLTLYFGVVVLAQGLEVGRKTQLLSRTLADLTSQTLPGTSTTGNCASGNTVSGVNMPNVPCLTDTDLVGIFQASTAVLYPFADVANMTITQVVFDNVSSSNSGCCRARVVWSAGYGNSPTLRACGLLTQSANGVNGPTYMPIGFYPGGAGDAATSGTYYVASNNKVDNFVIVADVTYNYAPGFGFQPYLWNRSANGGTGYTIRQTTYMTPRFGSSVTQSSIPAPSSPTTSNPRYDQLIYWTPSGTLTAAQKNVCSVGTGSTQYNLP